MSRSTSISVVLTAYQTEKYLESLCKEIDLILTKLQRHYEIIIVDDSSRDNTWGKIQQISSENGRVRAIQLSRNFGQQIAVSAGLSLADGDYVLVMDSDFENPPSAIPHLIRELENGFDLVLVKPKQDLEHSRARTSRVFWKFLSFVSQRQYVERQLMFRGMSNKFVTLYQTYQEKNRSVFSICQDIGLPQTTIEIDFQRRPKKASAYTGFQRISLGIDILLSSTLNPLKWASILGILGFFLASLGSIFYFCLFLLSNPPSGFATLVLLIMFFGSLVVLITSIVGLYVGYIFTEVRSRPLYLIKNKINVLQ